MATEYDGYASGETILWNLFNLQKRLIERYTSIEKLPPPPLNLHLPAHQVILKDFASRVVEELGESYESYVQFLEGKDVYKNIVNSNEELMDALHFLLELAIYCDVTSKDIEDKFGGTFEDSWCKEFYYRIGRTTVKGKIEDGLLGFKLGLTLSSEINKISIERSLWATAYKVQLIRNCLKNKPWKQTQMVTDILSLKTHVIDSMISLFSLFSVCNLPIDSILQFYFMKNEVNLFRINSKY